MRSSLLWDVMQCRLVITSVSRQQVVTSLVEVKAWLSLFEDFIGPCRSFVLLFPSFLCPLLPICLIARYECSFPNIVPFMRFVKEYGRTTEATKQQSNVAQKRCDLHAVKLRQEYRHTREIFHNYCQYKIFCRMTNVGREPILAFPWQQ